MPSYEFECQKCREPFEIFLTRIIRDEDKRCPKCGSENVSAVYKDVYGFGGFGGGGCSAPSSGFSFG